MTPERALSHYPEVLDAPTDPFNFDNVFYTSLVKLGWAITLEPGEEGFITASMADQDKAKKVWDTHDRVWHHSLGALFRAMQSGPSEIFLLLQGKEGEFYERYPDVAEKIKINREVLKIFSCGAMMI